MTDIVERLREHNEPPFDYIAHEAAAIIEKLREVSQQQLDAAYGNGYDAAYAMGYSEGMKETLYDGMPRLDDRGDNLDDTEKLAQMMIRCGLATGHGDTIDDLIFELEKQIKNTSNAFSDAQKEIELLRLKKSIMKL